MKFRRTSRPAAAYRAWRSLRSPALPLLLLALACTDPGTGTPVRVRVREGASFREVADSLGAKHILHAPLLFRLYGRVSGRARQVKPGTYEFGRGAGWVYVLDNLVAGHFLTAKLVIPEGMEAEDIRGAHEHAHGRERGLAGAPARGYLSATRFGVPGPTLEGYLYPDTYTFPIDAQPDP